jgi:ABC-type uncharacterized transport system substrate-binding protein
VTARIRVVLVAVLAATFVVRVPVAEPQQPAATTVWRIGVLTALYPPDAAPSQAFRQQLRALGYVEGQNLVIEWRYAQGQDDRLPALAAELVRLNVHLLVADATIAIRAAMKATSTIPIVMANHPDPVGSGLVASLARPGGNVTGLSLLAPELRGKQLQLLKETVPRLGRVAVLMNPTIPSNALAVRELEVAAQALKLRLQVLKARAPAEFGEAFSAATHERAEALLIITSSMFFAHRVRLVELVARNRLPAVYSVREFVEVGGLIAYGADIRDSFRRAAWYVDQILKGTKPGDLPIEQPTKFELVINLRAARALGLAIPPAVLARADKVIE